MTALANTLAPYSKAITVALVLAVVLVLDANGVDVPVDVDGLWEHLLAILIPTAAVYVAPANRVRRAQ